MRFEVEPELRLFAESVRSAVGDWEPPREPALGEWQDDRDDALASRIAAAGWDALWEDADGLAAAVAGGVELGRALAPVCVVDEATLGAPLSVASRIRHGLGPDVCAVVRPGWGLASGTIASDRRQEPTLDGSGTVRAEVVPAGELANEEAAARWDAWTSATLAYLAGLAGAALETTARHARSREQFGRPLSRMPTIQARLADAALAADGILLVAWRSATPAEGAPREAALLWAGSACREVTATAHQVHGAIGFALESGVHRYHRRAKALQVWAAAVCEVCR